MYILAPNYYEKFSCIAEKCKHNCCIGWEIGIDDETLHTYFSLNGDFGNCLRNSIVQGENAHFKLEKGNRCPHLNEKGLCDIIINLGEDALCNICADHPRFRNFYSNFVEIGLGLCCEEAARIILYHENPFEIVTDAVVDTLPVTKEEEAALCTRQGIFDILQDRTQKIEMRFEKLAKIMGFSFFDFETDTLCDFYLSLERLDEHWTELLQNLKGHTPSQQIFEKFSLPFEQFACYMIYRHFTKGIADYDFRSKVIFALSACFLLAALCSRYGKNPEEYARMFSAEVEYSEENLKKMYLDFLVNEA